MNNFILHARDANRPNVRDNLVRAIDALPDTHTYVVELKRYQKPRTDTQNSALWGVAYKALRDQMGEESDALHEFFCGEWFGWVDRECFGRITQRPRRTTTHDENGKRDVIVAGEFAKFYDFIQYRAAQHGFSVPDPDPLWHIKKRERTEG